MTDQNTTVRTSTTTILHHLRNVRNRIALLTLRRTNRQYLTAEENHELAELQRRRVRLEKEYADAQTLEQQKAKTS